MKRRVISILSMIAMLCTMIVFAMPEVAAAVDYPRYKDHAQYGADQKDWSISSPEDWDAMRAVADVATEDYFEGVTFHLTNDIDFAIDSSNRRQPMGINTNGAAFAGTIDGHGYGFNNIYIYNSEKNTYGDLNSAGDAVIHSGLFLRLGNCTFRDFGLNSGLILQGSSNASGTMSSFGTVMNGKTPTFERVWSSIYLSAQCNARLNGLVGTISSTPVSVNVNGFVFDGVLAKQAKADVKNPQSFALLYTGSSTAPGSYKNVITDFEVYNGKVVAGSSANTVAVSGKQDYGSEGVQSALIGFTSEDVAKATTIENVYGVKRAKEGINDGYMIGTTLSGSSYSASLLTDMSAAEAAWTINQNPTEDAVYFTLNDKGQVRPIAEGKSEGKIVKIGVTGDAETAIFVAPNATVDLKAALGYKSDLSFEIISGECAINGASVTVGTADVTLKMTNSCVDHNVRYESDGESQKHTGTCSICGHKIDEDCTLTNFEQNDMEWNTINHTGDCSKCDAKNITQVCDFKYQKTENGYKYVCACGRTEDASAPMSAGDVNEKGGIDLVDAIHTLKRTVDNTFEIVELNADVNGNGGVDVNDVYKIILYFMGEPKTVREFAAAEARYNEANFYNANTTELGNIKMDGTEGTNERYIRTDYISVTEGNKVVFGPVRKAQAVLGHFYDANGNAIELINMNNEKLTTVHTFKAEVKGKDVEVINYGESAVIGELETKVVDGLEMVSIEAPAGAAYVRLQANANEADAYYVRINNEFSLADYQCRTNGDADTLTNEERGQLFLTVGDSLCSAARDDQDSTVPKKGWEGRINRNFGAVTVDSSQGGTTISTTKYFVEYNPELDTEGSSGYENYCIVNQITKHRGGQAFEYILLEGGANDAAYDGKIGYEYFNPDSHDPADFAPADTFVGGLERAIYTIIHTYGDTVAFGYLVPYPMNQSGKFTDLNNYFQYVDEICKKWDIPYLDFFYDKLKNFDTVEYTTNSDHTAPDYIHADGRGYDIMQIYIDEFVQKEMRPVNQEIYLEIQQYENVPQNLDMYS